MIKDLLTSAPDPAARRDVCIVGAGAAGIALAVELERLGKSVLMLEGGGEQLEDAAQEPYQSEVVGHEHRGIHTGRFRAQGGTTLKWGGQILELDPIDFSERSWVPESGWPFSKQELTPFYARALEIEGVDASIQQDAAVWKELGLPVPHFKDLEPYFSRWCPEPNFATLHRSKLDGPAIEIWLHANAVELLLEGEEVQGIRCRTQGGKNAIFRASEYVFCLGTIESSRFFLQPRTGASRLPWNDSGLLGRHFQDHIDANAASVIPRSPAEFHNAFDNVFLGGRKYHPKLKLAPAMEREAEVLNVAATMYFLSDIDEELAAIKSTAKRLLRGKLREVESREAMQMLRNLPLLFRQSWRYAVEHRAFNPPGASIQLRVHCEQAPDTGSSITLSEERDSLDLLRTRLDWKIEPVEIRTIQRFVETAKVALDSLAEIVPQPSLYDGNFATHCDDSNHHMGGMRMSASPTGGVVDPDLRLNGTRNCYVCSGAVFPTSGFSNPTHTLLALAVRLARHLAA
jgi:choline dehydrogenase-like flavoprotein